MSQKFYISLSLLVLILGYQNCSQQFQLSEELKKAYQEQNDPSLNLVEEVIPNHLKVYAIESCDEATIDDLVAATDLSSTCLQRLFQTDELMFAQPLGSETNREFKNFFEFKPQFSLYVYGAQKRRWIYLPPGSQVNTQDPLNWIFPVGTIFWKEFKIDGKVVELRRIVKMSNEADINLKWHFSTFISQDLVSQINQEVDSGDVSALPDFTNMVYSENGFSINHSMEGHVYEVPRNVSPFNDCSSCHKSGHDGGILGFNNFQLSITDANFDKNIFKLNEKEIFDQETLPDLPLSQTVYSEKAQKAIGYIHTNCSSCHSPNGKISAHGDFRHQGFGSTLLNGHNIYKTFIDSDSSDNAFTPLSNFCNLVPNDLGVADINTIPVSERGKIRAFEGMLKPSGPMPKVAFTNRHTDPEGRKILGEWLVELHNDSSNDFVLSQDTYCRYKDSFFDPNVLTITPQSLSVCSP